MDIRALYNFECTFSLVLLIISFQVWSKLTLQTKEAKWSKGTKWTNGTSRKYETGKIKELDIVAIVPFAEYFFWTISFQR